MTNFTGNNGANTADAPGGFLVGFTGGTLALLQDATGDVINGLGGSDFVSAGAGNDNVNGGSGNDTLFGNDGNDTLNAGTNTPDINGVGFEILVGGQGNDTFNVSPATTGNVFVVYSVEGGAGGVTVNLATDTAIDTFGDTDTLTGVTFVVATDQADLLTGDVTNDSLAPGRGVDTIDGGGGIDVLAYYFVIQGGGPGGDGFSYTSGITVTHSGDNAGTVIDPNGDTDTFTNIEIIAGTRFVDNMTGSTADDWFIGGEGNDILNGGAGGAHDIIDYSLDAIGGGIGGVTVDLGAGTATDAFGDTDTLSFIDDVIGTRFDDSITGNLDANTFAGGLGKDTMTGGADNDTFDFNIKTETAKGANRDVITDFSGVNGGELDLINLFDIDAKSGAGNQAFKFIGAAKFHHRAGELQVKYNAVTDVAIISGDIDGNGKADFQIEVHSVTALVKLDFVL